MPAVKNFNTIPELFQSITRFGKGMERPFLSHKVNGNYLGISYDEAKETVENFAYGLDSLGVKRGDRVAIISENRPKWMFTDFAILGLGAVDVPLYPILTADTIEFILNNSESVGIVVSNNFQLNKILKVRKKCKYLKFIIVLNDMDVDNTQGIYTFSQIVEAGKNHSKQMAQTFEELSTLAKPDDLCTIIYTSGTTGEPKGVLLTHKNICSNVAAAHEIFDITKEDTFLSFLPLCHIFERMAGYYLGVSSGAHIAFAEGIEKVASNLAEVKPTVMTAVPRLFERIYSRIIRNVESQSEKKQKIFHWAVDLGRSMAEAKRDGRSIPISLTLKHKLADKLVFTKLRERTGGNLRFFISGGAPLSRELGYFFEAVGLIILEGYGLTESSPVIAVNRLNDYKFGTVGKVLPGVEVKIAHDGEILAYGPNIMKGYYKNKKETDAVLKNGWLHTGDIGVFDAEGHLIITDRKKSLFKTSGGKYVAPSPIENMFLASKYIEQFILIGDRRMFLTALIVPDYEALKEYADAHRISYSDVHELVNMKQIYEMLEKEMSSFQKNLASYERIRKFSILENPLTIEGGELTPKLSVKRKVVEERYSNLIDDMYKDLEGKA